MIILLPVYNDWKSLHLLLPQLQQTFGSEIKFLIVDDGSTDEIISFNGGWKLTVIHLTQNLGHQKAIAIGLSYISEHFHNEDVLIMDADGNDIPADAMLLKKNQKVIREK